MMSTRSEQLAHDAVRIIAIAEGHAFCRAHGHARGIESLLDAMNAERAFVRIAFGRNEARIIRARGDARFAAGAFVAIDQHDAALGDMARAGWATAYARRVLAMIAALRANLPLQMRKRAAHVLHDSITAEAVGNMVFSSWSASPPPHSPRLSQFQEENRGLFLFLHCEGYCLRKGG